MSKSLTRISVERLEKTILLIRGEKVILDTDLGSAVWSDDYSIERTS